ncbi:sugar ABC transporter substrate-binding protein [Betaproteobacteria bacterium GR16-43]|nr:sugar ABC transporter substrate-binding protein [Betaproteobacteria bacterium GR16-43]
MDSRLRAIAAAVASAVSIASPAGADEIVVQSINAYVKSTVDNFNRENPGDKVHFRLVSYQSINDSLPVQLASGGGPDISMVADWNGLAKYYLDLRPYVDAAYFEREFGTVLAMLRARDARPDAINGMTGAITMNGAYVNRTLFRQAGIAMPSPGATWDDWADAARRVAKATRTPMAMEVDRSAHRFASIAISYGAKLVDANGDFVVDEGLKAAIRKFVAWHRDGTLPMDLWGAVGGATHRDNFDDFMNAKVVLYFGGSWQLERMNKEVGDLFDWAVIDAPCGPAACALMPGGGAMVAFKHTKSPKLAARYLAFAAREENMREQLARGANIPLATTLVKTGVSYPNASELVREALASYTRQVPSIPPAAYAFQGWRFQRAAMNAMTTRISQVLNNELDVDTAAAFIKKDVDLAIQAARR